MLDLPRAIYYEIVLGHLNLLWVVELALTFESTIISVFIYEAKMRILGFESVWCISEFLVLKLKKERLVSLVPCLLHT